MKSFIIALISFFAFISCALAEGELEIIEEGFPTFSPVGIILFLLIAAGLFLTYRNKRK